MDEQLEKILDDIQLAISTTIFYDNCARNNLVIHMNSRLLDKIESSYQSNVIGREIADVDDVLKTLFGVTVEWVERYKHEYYWRLSKVIGYGVCEVNKDE